MLQLPKKMNCDSQSEINFIGLFLIHNIIELKILCTLKKYEINLNR